MRNYRLLLLDQDGHLVGRKCIACVDDQEAITAALSEVRTCEYVEVWNGGRPVYMCARTKKRRAKPGTLVHRWLPKAALPRTQE